MNGYGHFLIGWSWFSLYWGFFTAALLLLAQTFWVRGLSQEWRVRARQSMQKMRGGLAVAFAICIVGFIATGSWIFYNTNVLNQYQTKTAALDEQAEYEKKYKQYYHLPHPRLTDVNAKVDIYPAERKVLISGHYVLQNKSDKEQDTLRLQVNTQVKT